MRLYRLTPALRRFVSCVATISRASIGRDVTVLGVELDAANCGPFIHAARPHLLRMRRVQTVQVGADASRRVVLLGAELHESTLPLPLSEAIERAAGQLKECHVHQGYDDLSAREVLQQLLPEGVVVPSAYERAGHLVHLNLRPEQLPHRFVIGKVLLDKLQPHVRTVVNKANEITSEFRNLPLELIAGEAEYEVTVKHGDALLSFDYSKVYWNSRLHTEHERMARSFERGQVRPLSQSWVPCLPAHSVHDFVLRLVAAARVGPMCRRWPIRRAGSPPGRHCARQRPQSACMRCDADELSKEPSS